MWQPIFGAVASVHVPGNHEIEYNRDSPPITPSAGPSLFAATAATTPFQAYATRMTPGTVPFADLGDTWQTMYWSQDVGPVHLLVLNPYVPCFADAGARDQYDFAVADLRAVNRTKTPWLVVSIHAPVYTSSTQNYKHSECFRVVYEDLFYGAGVDIVLSGHIHTYERTHPMYRWRRDPCGPVWILVGNGGTVEGIPEGYTDFTTAMCQQEYKNRTLNAVAVDHDACLAVNKVSFQATYSVGGQPGYVPNPKNASEFFCQSSQPLWSAFRARVWGFAELVFLTPTVAEWRFFAQSQWQPGQALPAPMDSATIVRRGPTCV
jgi:hypothetical protein